MKKACCMFLTIISMFLLFGCAENTAGRIQNEEEYDRLIQGITTSLKAYKIKNTDSIPQDIAELTDSRCLGYFTSGVCEFNFSYDENLTFVVCGVPFESCTFYLYDDYYEKADLTAEE